MELKALRGRLIAEIIPTNESDRKSGLIIINRKDIPVRATVTQVGEPSFDRFAKKKLYFPAKPGDIIHFKKYKPHFHDPDKEGTRKGTTTVWWSDIVAIESSGQLIAPWDMVIVKLIHKEVSPSIIIPEKYEKQNKGFFGSVVSVGELYPNKELNVGDSVIFPRHEGVPVFFNEEEYLSLKERWVNGRMD